jgi:hypothetical protein
MRAFGIQSPEVLMSEWTLDDYADATAYLDAIDEAQGQG